MTEKEFTDQVVDLAMMCGYLVHHDRGDMRQRIQGHAGFPDLCMTNGPRLIFAELKVGKNKPTSDQARWLVFLAGRTVEVYLWRPEDMPAITELLTAEDER